MNSLISNHHGRKPSRLRGMTLVELMIAISVATLLMAGVLTVVIVLARTAVKNERLERTASQARAVQELLTQELNSAINIYDENAPTLVNRPTFTSPDTSTPKNYRQINYRVPVGPPGSLTADIPISSSEVTFSAPSALKPAVGDYLILDTPKLGRGILITAVSDTRSANTDGNVTVTLNQSLSDGTVPGYVDSDLVNAPALTRVEIQRERAFVVDPPAVIGGVESLTTSLRWVENVSSGASRTLTTLVDSSSTYIFRQVPEQANALETAVSWFLALLDSSSTSGLPGSPVFFSSSSVGGQSTGDAASLIMPKSGNSISLSNPFSSNSTSVSTTTTTSLVSSTSSTKQSSTSSTKQSSTSSTKQSTSSTSQSTSSTKVSSTSSTKQSTSSTKQSTSSTKQSTSSTKVSSTSSTKQSTSSTSQSTSSTKVSSTSSTKQSTSTTNASSTSSTKQSSTSSTRQSSTTTSTSIPFDG